MIVVVEGPSAAGKTTWAAENAAGLLIPESERPQTVLEDPQVRARYWAQRGARRWMRAIEVERSSGTAVCDTDPLKLHYAWSLWRIGEGGQEEFRQQAEAYRAQVLAKRLGFADAYLVSIPPDDALALRRSKDTRRRRRNFELHRRLGEPLREWYELVERLRPGSVVWTFPEHLADVRTPKRSGRSDIADFDRLVALATDVADR